MLFYAYRPIL